MKTEKKQHIDNSNYGYWKCPIHGTGLQCCKKSKWIEQKEPITPAKRYQEILEDYQKTLNETHDCHTCTKLWEKNEDDVCHTHFGEIRFLDGKLQGFQEGEAQAIREVRDELEKPENLDLLYARIWLLILRHAMSDEELHEKICFQITMWMKEMFERKLG